VIALVDYGAGNLASVRKALTASGASVFTPGAPRDVADAMGIVVPGVGHFRATRALDPSWRAALAGAVGRGVPLLGICLGMQWLFQGSEEAPDVPGLGVFAGRVTRLADRDGDGTRLKIPHVGWNRVRRAGDASLPGLADGDYLYFTHTFAAPVTDDCAGVAEYGCSFAAAARRGRVWGVQFHPEKSGAAGLAVLRAFVGCVDGSQGSRASRGDV
jgi:imidazole glycerol-phosphate synthase subunit HisH